MPVEFIETKKLIWEKRNYPTEYYQKLFDHIREHGILCPVMINKEYKIIDGNVRVQIAYNMEIPKIPCIIMDVSDAIIAEYRTMKSQSH